MNISIWVTDICNLSCKYCYVNENKGDKKFSYEKIHDFLTFIDDRAENEPDEEIQINFFGGEPLIAFDIIKEIVSKIKEKPYHERVFYFITSNGLLLDEKIANFFKENQFAVSISIDGTEEIHNKNRKDKNHFDTYEKVIQGCELLARYGVKIRVRGTYDSETVDTLYQSTKHLAGLSFANEVVMVPDYFDTKWNEKKIEKMKQEVIRIRENLSDKIYMGEELKGCKTWCGGGISSFHIDINGNIFPCSYVVGKEFCIGTLKEGLDRRKIDELKTVYRTRNKACNGCGMEDYCLSRKCKFINYALTGNLLEPSPVVCHMEKLKAIKFI
ncbi:MAG: radical SAM protein [Lachnospiraceae bacterium]|nr:radical SAM protein [Lachnospiraceae bacterium]